MLQKLILCIISSRNVYRIRCLKFIEPVWIVSLRKKCPNTEFFLVRIWTHFIQWYILVYEVNTKLCTAVKHKLFHLISWWENLQKLPIYGKSPSQEIGWKSLYFTRWNRQLFLLCWAIWITGVIRPNKTPVCNVLC